VSTVDAVRALLQVGALLGTVVAIALLAAG
jgi:hypothetical protein